MSKRIMFFVSILMFASLVFASANIMVANTNFSGPGSLGQAITDANANPDHSFISFDIPGAGPHEIVMGHSTGELPEITSHVSIDGTNKSGGGDITLVGMAPTSPGPPVDGLIFLAGSERSDVTNIKTRGFLNAFLVVTNTIKIASCTFDAPFAKAINAIDSSGILIDNNTFINNDSISILLQNCNSFGILNNNILSGSVILSSSSNITIGLVGDGNIFNNNTQSTEAAILVYGTSENVDIIGNVISDQTQNGIMIAGTTTRDHDIVHNTFSNNKEYDIVAGGDNLYIHSNQITGDQIAAFSGIKIAGATNLTITGNTLDGARIDLVGVTSGRVGGLGGETNVIKNDPQGVSAYAALMLKGSSNLLIMSNEIYNNASNGIQLEASDNNEIYMCDVYGNGRTGVKVISGNYNKISRTAIYDHGASAQGGMDSISLLSGANEDIAAPVITSIVKNGDLLEISGTTSVVNGEIEVFVSDEAPSQFTQNAYKVLRTTTATGSDWTITCGVAEFTGAAAYVTASVTDAFNNTSEFALVEGIVLTDGIIGPTSVVPGNSYQYSVADIPGVTFTWWVGGDANIAGNGNSTVTITFGTSFVGGLVNVGYTDPVNGWTLKQLQVNPQ